MQISKIYKRNLMVSYNFDMSMCLGFQIVTDDIPCIIMSKITTPSKLVHVALNKAQPKYNLIANITIRILENANQ